MENANKLLDCYHSYYKFPDWVVLCQSLWNKFKFSSSVVFYHKEDSLDDVKNLIKQREPTNIAMRSLYDSNKLN